MRKAILWVHVLLLCAIPIESFNVRQSVRSNNRVFPPQSSISRREKSLALVSRRSSNHENDDLEKRQETRQDDDDCASPKRRQWFLLQMTTLGPAMLCNGGLTTDVAWARGLVQFPCDIPLSNTYHFVRAGTSLLEEEGIWSTNPLFLTNRDDALSVKGEEQILRVAEQLRDRYPTVVKYSLAARCIDTANLIGRELKIGRNNLVPEFTFLDPRGLGGWDMTRYDTTYPAIFALDNDQAGTDGLNARPVPNEDGTPHETLSDVAIRFRQLLSILESQYSGETILLVFPDGTGPALLSAMMAGIPYNRVHELEFAPGEIRFDITKESTLALWNQKQLENAENYQSVLKQGRDNLKNLQEGKGIKNLKDERIEAERIAIDKAYEEKERRRALALQRDEELRRKRQRELIAASPDEDREIPPLVLGTVSVAAMGGIGLAALNSRQGSSAIQDNRLVTNTTYLSSNVTVGLGLNRTMGPTLTTTVLFDNTPLLDENGGGGDSIGGRGSLYSSNTLTRQRVNGDRNSLLPVAEVDPQEAAKRAMEEYMNRDDGASDWLLSLTEILEEEEEDDESLVIQDVMQNSTQDEQTFQ